ncbi:MAG: hypothetical protein DMG13_25095 [Acidobacteria bacterium]|nr:MAG: hypothetical protein DMG13_25095 [Acidobacteriota bacterium]
MRNKVPVLVLLWLLFLNINSGLAEELGTIFKNIYGPKGLVVDSEAVLNPGDQEHFAHFNSSFQSSFNLFNIAMASQLTAVPLPSPASGFTYVFRPETGAFARSTQSFGPILADRAETLGRRRFSLSFNYQRFSFDSIEGVDLKSVPAVFTHDDRQLGGGRLDVVTTDNSIKATVGQFTAFFNYGITDRLDVSVAVPTVKTTLSLTSNATIQRLGTTDPKVHFFRDASGGIGNFRSFTSSGSKTGIGDLIFRTKGNVLRREHTGVALGVDFRAPTGDEKNLLGSGAPGVKPFAVLSYSYKRIAPHVNVGYQWNGKSILAGDVATQTKADLPDQVLYTAGLDVGVVPRLTVAFDVLGQRVIDSPELVRVNQSFSRLIGPAATFPNIQFNQKRSFNIINGAIGLKVNPAPHLLIGVNALFKMNDSGLRDKVTPLVGIEYSF